MDDFHTITDLGSTEKGMLNTIKGNLVTDLGNLVLQTGVSWIDFSMPEIAEPIFIYQPVDLMVFETVSFAERYLEPKDTMDEDYEYFDSEGRILEASVVQDSKRMQRILIEPTERFDREKLQRILVAFLCFHGYSQSDVSSWDLRSLATASLRFALV